MKKNIIEPGKVIEPMVPEYSVDIHEILKEHNYNTQAELKYDGYRFQLHKKGDLVVAYTRNLNKICMELFPEFENSINKLPDCILDCELNGGVGHNGFKKVKKRFRPKISKQGLEDYLGSGLVGACPMELKVFDTLYWDGKKILDISLEERRGYTETIDLKGITPSRIWRVGSVEDLKHLFDEVTHEKHEGLVCKDPKGVYIPGARGQGWYKLKKFETLDLVILGIYMENGKIGQFLCGNFNPYAHTYEALGKVNAKREGIGEKMYAQLKNKFQQEKPSEIMVSEKMKQKPDFYIAPHNSAVLEIRAMNLNFCKNEYMCGFDGEKSYSMRIAWMYDVRETKKPTQATTTEQIKKLYKIQSMEEKDGQR